MVKTADTMSTSRSPWTAALSAPVLSFAPIRREMTEATPAPSPLESPMRIMKSGVTNPTAARALEPRPATQMALTMLYVDISNIATIMGPESFRIAFFGSPIRSETPAVAVSPGGNPAQDHDGHSPAIKEPPSFSRIEKLFFATRCISVWIVFISSCERPALI